MKLQEGQIHKIEHYWAGHTVSIFVKGCRHNEFSWRATRKT